ncbi:hypothetical protein [Massilia pseudoviolaceinigra]|uniref:hypothetical protein n=1 Tax=Massilia pseudoviolaceinigra TaxID=3057165 RepID=UPI002796423A|nr:hypothetical protein [Massilia sp. CCM 9206]MDQ1921700.1 hypothetical protein [Massilia sp. CCM 9206]
MKASALPAINYAPLDPEACKHQMILMKALHCAHPVIYEGKQCVVQEVSARQAGGRIEGVAYLRGNPEPVECSKITLQQALQ